MLIVVARLIAAFVSRSALIRIAAVANCPFVKPLRRRTDGRDNVRPVVKASIIGWN